MSSYPSCRSMPNLSNSGRRGYSLPIATLTLIVCTNVQTLILDGVSSAPQALTETLLEECLALGRVHSSGPQVPLASLREFRIECPTTIRGSDHNHQPGSLNVGASHWFSRPLQLPKIESIKVGRLPQY
jgi:hypothetical protein